MDSEIASLMAGISFWECWGYVSLAAVLIGVAGESIKEFTKWLECIGWEKRVSRLSALILIAGLAGEGITQPNTNAANATLIALLNKQAAQLSIVLEKERQKTSARPWTKKQFDAIQELRGKVKDVGIIVENGCLECGFFATTLRIALNAAKIQMYEPATTAFNEMRGTGLLVYLPEGADFSTDPLVVALKKANLNPATIRHTNFRNMRTDIPVIFVGEKGVPFLEPPFIPNTNSAWKTLPLEK